MDHSAVKITPVTRPQEAEFQDLMQAHHYLGALPKIGHTIRYVATIENQCVALLSFSAAALKCAARDDWIGWGYRNQFDRLNLVANNSRFLILPGHHYPNLASRILSRCQRRLQQDWLDHFSQPLLLLETFVDPTYFQGTIYRASNWLHLGSTKGYQRTRTGYSERSQSKKLVFVQPLQRDARRILSSPILDEYYQTGKSRMRLTADQMFSLSDAFSGIEDARRAQGRKHHLANVLSLSAGAILCGMRGYKDIALWADSLSQQARGRFRCRKRDRRYEVPSRTVIRNVLTKVDPAQLDHALNAWNEQYAGVDESLAIDGKTMRGALDCDGKQTHIMSAVGHESSLCYTQKK